mgnify:CR=1 FL=1
MPGMFNGLKKRVVCMWFPRLASDRALKVRPVDAPFALTLNQHNTDRIYCLNQQAEALGLHRTMCLADARAICPTLVSHSAQPDLDARFLATLRRWATRYCPWVGYEGPDGLVLDLTGSTHLWPDETAIRSGRWGRCRWLHCAFRQRQLSRCSVLGSVISMTCQRGRVGRWRAGSVPRY